MITPLVQWVEPVPMEIPPGFKEAVGGPVLLVETLLRRGYDTIEKAGKFLDTSLYSPAPPGELPDLQRAVDRLEIAIQNREMIGVWGDFDVDGQTASALLVGALRKLGARVCYHIPVRAVESHGIILTNLQAFLNQGVELLLTCDTGVTENEAVEYAQSKQVDVLITDHHTLPPQLPSAYAVVNPQRLLPNHPLAPLCGVGCAYKLIEELFHRAGRQEEAQDYLDLVALGTVADVARLIDDNRYLVQKGLIQLREDRRLGLKILLEQAEIVPLNLTEEHIGYALAPRMNAIGRLADANQMVDFLLTDNVDKVRGIVKQMEELNSQRKSLCDQVFQAAQKQIETDPSLLDSSVLVLCHPAWHAGVLGLVASQMAELYQRPAILISAPQGQNGRGSARSIEGINITSALNMTKDLLERFGGHPMAAGFSIPTENIARFRGAISRAVTRMVEEKPLVNQIPIDAYLTLADINLELVEQLDRLSPFGAGNPVLTLATFDLEVKSSSKFGEKNEHLQLIVEDASGNLQRVIWWNGGRNTPPEGRFDMAYTLRASNYRGQKQVQVEWIGSRLKGDETPAELTGTKITILDYRQELDAEKVLASLVIEPPCIVWQEGQAVPLTNRSDRFQLSPVDSLIIWSIPPGLSELKAALAVTAPHRIYLFAAKSSTDELPAFLKQLFGLIRYSINKNQGWVDIRALAVATAQREDTILQGIDWLIGHGSLKKLAQNEQGVQMGENGQIDQAMRGQSQNKLETLLKETAAFREYFLHADTRWFIDIAGISSVAGKHRLT